MKRFAMAMVLCLAVGFVMTKPGSKSISEVEEVQQKSAPPSLWEEYRQEQLRNYKEEQGALIKKSNEEATRYESGGTANGSPGNNADDVADTTDSHTSIISIEENAYIIKIIMASYNDLIKYGICKKMRWYDDLFINIQTHTKMLRPFVQYRCTFK